MSISFDEDARIFTLHTKSTTYQMQVNSIGHLLHLYYGRKIEGERLGYQYVPTDCGFSPNSYTLRDMRTLSLDVQPQEYSGSNTGDFRLSSLEAVTADGAFGADIRYVRHTIQKGKYAIDGIPSAFDRNEEAETLCIVAEDPAIGLQVELLYGVFPQQDVITRAVRLKNAGSSDVRLEKAASACLDIPFGDWEVLHLYGRHTMERKTERIALMHGIQTITSRRGASSHHHNPFVVLCDPAANEDQGECIGMMLVYSGNHSTEIELDQMGSTRVVMGIHSEQFSWALGPGETFSTPEVIMTFTHQGLTHLSHTYHRFIRNNIMTSRFAHIRRPVLINNWEATYFAFDAEKILHIARQAADLGVELMVLDDGWFGKRNDDNASLGDWYVNEEKLPGGLNPLIEKIHEMGMQFGLWIEPEMVNEDSDLYRAHPDWALKLPNRQPAMGRNQRVLDISRPEVVEHLYQVLSNLLEKHDIFYIKWDMNRNMTDVYSVALPAEKQGEVFHRYILGVYSLLKRLTERFPNVLFEGCAGGGGRFDAGMLAYCPQIWCSDNTDAIERLTIQHGTSFAYPVSCMGSHVSTCPNHQTGRTTPLGTRATVAMSGTFGYEMDLNELSDRGKDLIRRQIRQFHTYYDLIQNGNYYRLEEPEGKKDYTAWQFVEEDQKEVLLNLVVTHTRSNPAPIHIRMKGLDPAGVYELRQISWHGYDPVRTILQEGKTYRGSSLMYAGLTLPLMFGDYPSTQLYFVKQE